MTPLQKLAMGFVIVLIDPVVGGFDAIPDVLGWALVLAGLAQLRDRLAGFTTLVFLGAVSAVISVVLFWPPVAASVSPSAGWLLSLPSLVLVVLLAGDLARLAAPTDHHTARRFRFVRGWFVVLAVLPVLVYGGGLEGLLVLAAVLVVTGNVYLIYLLFKVSQQTYALPTSA